MPKNKITLQVVLLISVAVTFIYCNQVNTGNTAMVKPVIEPAKSYTAVDKSPLDISYYPANYPMLKMNGGDTNTLIARLIYSRPQKNGRIIFGNDPSPKCVQQYGAYWRLGANEASEIEFFKTVNIKGQKILKGRYIIYCIPYENKWTIVFNSNLFSWGLHPDTKKDIAKIEIPVLKTNQISEYLSMVFEQAAAGANLIIAWDNVKASLPISF
jgi:Protein of unknown function (DUF2911)